MFPALTLEGPYLTGRQAKPSQQDQYSCTFLSDPSTSEYGRPELSATAAHGMRVDYPKFAPSIECQYIGSLGITIHTPESYVQP